MTTTVYLIGEPGIGKSTLAAELRSAWSELTVEKRPLRHTVWSTPAGDLVAELGRHDAEYPGTDTLAMSANREAVPWIASQPYPLVFAEGDRLANGPFLTAATEAGRLVLLHLAGPEAEPLADGRRAQRGSDQAPSWVQGRRTKAARLAAEWGAVELDARRNPTDLADAVRQLVPAL